MRLRTAAIVGSLGALLSVGGCDKNASPLFQSSATSYSSCLQRAAAGNTRLTADEIRSLCAESAGVITPTYEFGKAGGPMLPSNDFTRCYDGEKKKLDAKGVVEADRLAKLSCKYPEVK
jgi:hypothetical protein